MLDRRYGPWNYVLGAYMQALIQEGVIPPSLGAKEIAAAYSRRACVRQEYDWLSVIVSVPTVASACCFVQGDGSSVVFSCGLAWQSAHAVTRQ